MFVKFDAWRPPAAISKRRRLRPALLIINIIIINIIINIIISIIDIIIINIIIKSGLRWRGGPPRSGAQAATRTTRSGPPGPAPRPPAPPRPQPERRTPTQAGPPRAPGPRPGGRPHPGALLFGKRICNGCGAVSACVTRGINGESRQQLYERPRIIENTATPHNTCALKVEHLWGSDGGIIECQDLPRPLGSQGPTPAGEKNTTTAPRRRPGRSPEEHNNGTTAAPGARTPRASGEPRH